MVSSPKSHPKVPPWEQQLSAGASALNIVTAATALGYIGAKAAGAIPTLSKIVGDTDKAFSADPTRAELRARAQQAINQINMDE